MKRFILFLTILMVGHFCRGQSVPVIRYWFDENFAQRQVLTSNVQTVDASMLSEGIHTIHVQMSDTISVASALFYKLVPSTVDSVGALHYWFDEDYANRQQMTGNVQTIDASQLSEGIHTIHVQMGDHYPVVSALFFKTLTFETDTTAGLQYWFDEDFANLQQMTGNVQTIDASQLSEGIHTIHVKMGLTHPVASAIFYKTAHSTVDSVGTLYYWFDEDFTNRQQMTSNVLTVDASQLSEGIHTFHVQMGDNHPVVSALFYNVFAESSSPTEYRYAFNGNANYTFGHRDTTGTLPSSWIDLMAVDTFPFSSQRFHFEIDTANHPWAYSKNVISVMAMAKGHVLTAEKSYIDRRVGYAVVADTFARNTYEQFAKPTNNHIQWYQVPVDRGDSMAFKASRTCTMQLFDPEGEEVYRSANDTATEFTGLHASNAGTYYLAVHDGTYNGTENLRVDYFHCDRFAVLSQDVHRVGNGGISAITFQGNGFDSISSVTFVMGTDTIHHLYLDTVSRNTLTAIFDFEMADTGVYNAIFDFTGTPLLLTNNLTVETALSLNLVTSINYPSSFTRGSSTTYHYTVTNTGNMTAFNVPIYSYIGTSGRENITYLKLDGLDLPPLISSFEDSLLSDEDRAYLTDYEQNYGDDYRYYKQMTYDSLQNDSVYVRSNYFFCNIAPYETKQITLTITSTGSVEVWFSAPLNAQLYQSSNSDSISYKTRLMHAKSNSSSSNSYCCVSENFNNMVSGMSTVATDLASVSALLALVTAAVPVAGEITVSFAAVMGSVSCGLGTLSAITSLLHNIMCPSDGSSDVNPWTQKGLYLVSATNAIVTCIKAYVPEAKIAKLIPALNKIDWLTSSAIAGSTPATMAEFMKKPNCPPNNHDGGSSSSVPPVDPNELVGFVAESGSTYMPDTIQTIEYYIECENDPLVAQSAAHRIVIVDSLDVNQYDLSSFRPTKVSVGNHEMLLNGSQQGTYTMDLRPEMNTLAEVNVNLDTTHSVARWTITSIDPITLDPTSDVGEGVLPPNTNGNGIARVYYQIGLRDTFPDGTDISNQAYITFDYEDAIATPVWVNTVDAVAPISNICYGSLSGDSLTLSFTATDNRSGVWKYDLMGRNDSLDDWRTITSRTENVQTILVDSLLSDFCVVAIDSAGIRERKNLNTEYNVNTGLVSSGITTYLVQFLNWDNAVLSQFRMAQGQKPTYLGQQPNRNEDNYFRYRFKGWSPTLAPITGTTTYRALFDSIPKNFLVSFFGANGDTLQSDSIAYGAMPKYSGSVPEHALSDSMVYAFAGWNPPIGLVQGSTVYRPVFDSCRTDNLPRYGITFIDWNDSVLYSDSLQFGSTPYYSYQHPNRAETPYYRYSFAGWSSDVMPVTQNATYKAMYDSTGIKYSIRFVNSNGAVLQQDSLVYGDTAKYIGNTPARRTTRSHSYNFIGWLPTDTLVAGDATYTAQFDSVLNRYTVTFVDAYGATLSQQTLNYGDSIVYPDTVLTLPDAEPNRFTFRGWTPTLSTIMEDCTISPAFDTVFFCTEKYSTESLTACENTMWHGQLLTVSGTYNDTVIGASYGQCDSIYTVHFTIGQPYFIPEQHSICQGETYSWHNQSLTTAGVYYDSLQSVNGCDSVYELTLTVNPTYLVEESAVLPSDGTGYQWHNNTYHEAGDYTDTLVTALGCDSICTLHLTGSEPSSVEGTRIITIKLVPNPIRTGEIAYIYADWTADEQQGMIVEILTASGATVTRMKPETFPIQISGLTTSGTYMIRITTGDGGTYIRKLIVN